MEDTNTERGTVRYSQRKKRQRHRIRNRKRCPNCGEEYSHSSFYTHKCRTNDQEDEAFSLHFPTRTLSSSDSEFYVSCSDPEASSTDPTDVEPLFDCSIITNLEQGSYSFS